MLHDQYEEKQWFRQVWLWLILIAVSSSIALPFASLLIKAKPDSLISSVSIIVFLLSLSFVVGLNALFYFTTLKTKINKEQISILFPPFINRSNVFKWEDNKEAHIRKYNSLLDYGGRGIRYSWNGRAYNTAGNMGLQLIVKSGKKALIGTQTPKGIRSILKKVYFYSLKQYDLLKRHDNLP